MPACRARVDALGRTLSPAQKLPRLGWLLLAAIAIFWGTNWVAIKIAVAEIPIWQYRVATTMFAGVGLLAIAKLGGHSLRVPRFVWGPLLLGALFNVTAWQVLSAYGTHLIASGKAAVLAYTMPIWTTLIAVVFLRERLTWRVAAALGLSVCSVAVLVSSSLEALGESPLGILFILLAALSWAAGTVVQKRARWPISVVVMAGWQILVGGAPILAVALVMEPLAIQNASATALWSLAYSLLLPMLFCQYAWFKVVSLFPASIAAIGTVMVPMVGIISGAVLLDEPLGWHEIVALLSVVGAIALVIFQPATKVQAAITR